MDIEGTGVMTAVPHAEKPCQLKFDCLVTPEVDENLLFEENETVNFLCTWYSMDLYCPFILLFLSPFFHYFHFFLQHRSDCEPSCLGGTSGPFD